MIKNFLFDFGGVLCDLDFEGCMKSFAAIGFPAEKMTEETVFSGIFQQMNIGTISDEAFWEGLRQLGHVQASDDTLRAIWNSIIVGVPAHRFQALKQLGREYPLYMPSNVNNPHWEYCRQHVFDCEGECLTDLFRQLFLSYRMHKEKPNSDIFRQVLDETGLNAAETLFIDDRADNIATASAMGFATLQALGDEWIVWMKSHGFLK